MKRQLSRHSNYAGAHCFNCIVWTLYSINISMEISDLHLTLSFCIAPLHRNLQSIYSYDIHQDIPFDFGSAQKTSRSRSNYYQTQWCVWSKFTVGVGAELLFIVYMFPISIGLCDYPIYSKIISINHKLGIYRAIQKALYLVQAWSFLFCSIQMLQISQDP